MKKIVLSLLLIFALIPIVPSNTASADEQPQYDYTAISRSPATIAATTPDPPPFWPDESDDRPVIIKIVATIGGALVFFVGTAVIFSCFCTCF